MDIYKNNLKQSLSNYEVINSNICVSAIKDLALKDYYSVRKYVCHNTHNRACTCDLMLQVAAEVIEQGIVSLSETFKLLIIQEMQRGIYYRCHWLQSLLEVNSSSWKKFLILIIL